MGSVLEGVRVRASALAAHTAVRADVVAALCEYDGCAIWGACDMVSMLCHADPPPLVAAYGHEVADLR